MDFAIIVQLVFNSLLLITSITIFFVSVTSRDKKHKTDILFVFLLFTLTLLTIMGTGVVLNGDIYLDTAAILLGLITLYFGRTFGGLLSIVGIGFRIMFGIAPLTGTIEIVTTFLVAILFRWLMNKLSLKGSLKKIFFFFMFGVLISGVILLSHINLPQEVRVERILGVGMFVIIVFPLITLLSGLLMHTLNEFMDKNKELKYLAKHDPKTGLYNSPYFQKITEEIISNQTQKSMILCNINSMKTINEAYGFKTGDKIILDTATVLKRTFPVANIFRLSGNDFAVVQTSVNEFTVDKCERKLLEEIDKRIIDGIKYSVSLGSCVIKDHHFYQKAEDDMLRNKLLNSTASKNNIIDTIMNVLFEKDEQTRHHSRNVSEYAGLIAEGMGLKYTEVQEAKLAGMLHDIGKIITPNEVLQKTGQLTDKEYALMKQHVSTGHRILSSSTQLKEISNYVKCHHERIDGKGYPDKLNREDIPLISRIISVADSFDAMVGERPYKDSMTKDAAMNELLANTNTQFDPEVVDTFINEVMHEL